MVTIFSDESFVFSVCAACGPEGEKNTFYAKDFCKTAKRGEKTSCGIVDLSLFRLVVFSEKHQICVF